MTQTCNAHESMPDSVGGIAGLADRLGDIRQANVDHHLVLIEKAARMGAKVIGLGELFAGPYFALRRDPVWIGLAEDARTGPTVTAMVRAAQANRMVIVAPIYELDGGTGERYNTAVVIDAGGEILGKYRKAHIPVGSNEQGCFDEGFYYGPGQAPQNEPSPKILGDNPSFPVFQTAVGRIGVAICYDRHFEDVAHSLSLAGAQIIFSPAVTFGEKSERMWEIEFEVDASRHSVFIGGSNRRGTELPWGQPFFGRSYFVGPSGRPENLSAEPELIIADLDLDVLTEGDSSGWDLARDRRPDIYS